MHFYHLHAKLLSNPRLSFCITIIQDKLDYAVPKIKLYADYLRDKCWNKSMLSGVSSHAKMHN